KKIDSLGGLTSGASLWVNFRLMRLAGACTEGRCIMLAAKSRGADCRDNRQKPFEGHVQIRESTLTKNPSVVIEDFVRNHRGQTGRSRSEREMTRRTCHLSRLYLLIRAGSGVLRDGVRLRHGNHFACGTHSHSCCSPTRS